jgi:hypothetical protein
LITPSNYDKTQSHPASPGLSFVSQKKWSKRSFVFCQLEMMMESNFKKETAHSHFPAHFLSRKFHVAAP